VQVTGDFPFDIVKAVEFWITDQAQREPREEDLDRHRRIRPECTLIHQLGVAEHPMVNAYLLLFRHWIEKRLGINPLGHLPHGRKCIVVLSHDVDDPIDPSDVTHNLWKIGWCGLHGYWKSIPKESVRLLRRIKHRRATATDRHWVFEEVVREEAKHGFKSTFFFSAIRNPQCRHGYDVLYDIRSPRFRKVFDMLRKRGFEVGLHGSYGSDSGGQYFPSELSHLEDCSRGRVFGNRQHCWKMSDDSWITLETMAAAGLAYDSSIGFNDIAGFRRAIAFPFFPYSSSRKQKLGIMEIPAMLMDGAYFYKEQPAAEEVVRRFSGLLDQLKRCQGVGAVNWHVSTAFPGSRHYRKWGEAYLAILEALASDPEVAVMNCAEVYEYYRKMYLETGTSPKLSPSSLQRADMDKTRSATIKILMDGALGSNGAINETFIQRQVLTLQANAIEVKHLPVLRSTNRLRQRLIAVYRKFFQRALVTRKVRQLFISADIIHFQWPGHLLNWFSVARRFQKPIVLSLRGRQINIVPHMPGQEDYVRRLREMLPLCAAYHCVSEDIRRTAEDYGLVRSRARVITPAVDTDFFVPGDLPVADSRVKAVMVGGLIWRKGFEYALMALSRVVESGLDVTLSIVGDGPEADRIEYTADDLGIRSRVFLLGRQAPDDVRGILQNHHLFLHASLSEGIANVVLEGMACGLPVVSTAAGGMPEAMDDGEEGFLVPLRDVKAMADRLAQLATNPLLRAEMGRKARARAVRDFDLKDQGRKFVELYQEVLSRK
jgi:colanic acid/amylovoran biosynthesis glycosyltransferase